VPDKDYKKSSDEELIRYFQDEDNEAFNEIVERYKDKLVNFIYRYTGNRDDAEDFAQDAFLKLYKSKHLYKEIAKFSTWFYTIALNTVRTNLKKKSRMNTLSINNYDVENEKDFDLHDDSPEPDSIVGSQMEVEFIQNAINNLDKSFKEVILLRDVQNLEYDEIAKITGLPLGTVKSRINRGREKLKIVLSSINKK
jgi:RNA polymerase sigma-70 factor (ECF subfamily)